MARPRIADAPQRTWRTLLRRLGRRPSAAEYAKALGCSVRSSYRYMRVIDAPKVCMHCDGRGYL